MRRMTAAPVFPADLDGILHRSREVPPVRTATSASGHLTVVRDVFSEPQVDRMIALLDEAMYPALRRMWVPIPAEAITRMRRNYCEVLPKTTRLRTGNLDPGRSAAFQVGRRIGLVEMMRCEPLRRLGSAITGRRLRAGPNCQVLCYDAGDYTGPHNDHHPENPELRDGYVDVHIALSNRAVAHQWLVYEEGGYLTNMVDIASRSAILGYRLPFWHYTTPLVARPRHEHEARRWLLLSTYEIER
jgi:hypothetical protein